MATPARRRTRGRPVQHAHPEAREALLDAAVALFAEKGVAATTTAEIAARAGVTPALVHYYFRPREQLLEAVVDERLSRFVAYALRKLPGPSASLEELVDALVDGVFDAAQRMPWMPPIWIRDVVSGGGLLRDRMLRHLPVQMIGALIEHLARGRRRGEITADIEPGFAFLSLAGATLFPLATRPLWKKFPGGAKLSTAQLRRHAHAVLRHGLTGTINAPKRTPR
ncbi:MAG: TetR/AcrR family transcriptional regulator [Betaproteobacteria bacterium]